MYFCLIHPGSFAFWLCLIWENWILQSCACFLKCSNIFLSVPIFNYSFTSHFGSVLNLDFQWESGKETGSFLLAAGTLSLFLVCGWRVLTSQTELWCCLRVLGAVLGPWPLGTVTWFGCTNALLCFLLRVFTGWRREECEEASGETKRLREAKRFRKSDNHQSVWLCWWGSQVSWQLCAEQVSFCCRQAGDAWCILSLSLYASNPEHRRTSREMKPGFFCLRAASLGVDLSLHIVPSEYSFKFV